MAHHNRSKEERSRFLQPLDGTLDHTYQLWMILTSSSDFLSHLPRRLTSGLSPQQSSSLLSEVQSHIVTLRTCGASVLSTGAVDKDQDLDAKAVKLWNLLARLRRGSGTIDSPPHEGT